MKYSVSSAFLVTLSFLATTVFGQNPYYLKRSAEMITEVQTEVTSQTARYKPLFGIGDKDAVYLKGIQRFGLLTVDPDGHSKSSELRNEELVCYVLDGIGLLSYKGKNIPITNNDFFYIPNGAKYRFSNPRDHQLRLLVMGYKIPASAKDNAPDKFMIANAKEVKFQVLGQHGPTTTFQLLMGTTKSKRDRLSAALQVNSLFVMDFDVDGTNIPHRHKKEEEIYFVLQGYGEMVAGETAEGEEVRIAAKSGDAFYFANNTLVGFYSGTKEGESHARILAIRSRLK
jgi:mannose-6-phosphate isomerase-like protein (cupin superfamily)